MPALPDKFGLRGSAVPDARRDIAGISYDSPLYAAGRGMGATLSGLGGELRRTQVPAEGAKAGSQAAALVGSALGEAREAPDPGRKGIELAEHLLQGEEKILDGLSPPARQHYEPGIRAIFADGRSGIDRILQPQRQEAKVAEVTALMAPASVQHAGFADGAIRMQIAAPVHAAIDGLHQDGVIDGARAQGLKEEFQRRLVEEDVKAQPAAWRIAALQRRAGDTAAQSYFRRELGAEKADLLLAQAQWQDKADRRESATQSLLDRFGIAPGSEDKALAEIRDKHGDDPGLQRLYLGRLQVQRQQERQALARSAGAAYRLALEGRQGEIDPADAKRLHDAGQMEGIFEAAQFARSVPTPGDLLFKERYLAMGEAERAGYGVAELAKRLSPREFLEVTERATEGGIDETQRTRMEGFVQAVQPMLRSVTLGEYATPEEMKRDERLLALIHDELQTLAADEEKKIGRPLTSTEYQEVIRQAANRALLHNVGLEGGESDSAVSDMPAWAAGSQEGSGMPSAAPDGYNVAVLGGTDALSDSERQAYLTNATGTDDPDSEEGDGEPGTLLAQRGSGSNRGRGPGGRPLSTEEILRVDSYNRATQRITAHKRDYTELRPKDFVPTPRQLEHKERQANAVEFFATRNIELDTHAMIRFGERGNRGVTLPDALRAYNTGRLYYDIKYRTYIRYDVQTGVWVATSAPRGGQILTVAQGNSPSPRWRLVPYR